MRRAVVRAGSGVVAAAVAIVLATTGAAPDPGPAWGVVDSACRPERMTAQRAAGLTVVVVEAYWDRLQPVRGAVDGGYATTLRAQVDRCADAGFRVVLGSGVQYPPAWVRSLPGAQPRDQYGLPPVTGEVDAVFAASVRDARATYLAALVQAVPAHRVEAVRIGTSGAGEIGYPGPDAGGRAWDSWWAFSDAAQTGRGLAAGQERTPMPGWVPGSPRWAGRAVTPAAAGAWWRWYRHALLRSLRDQAQVLRAVGYRGALHVPAPGRGVLPSETGPGIAALLGGPLDDDWQRGLDYVDQFPLIAQALPGPIVIDLTSVDDATTVAARRAGAGGDRCTGDDAGISISGADVSGWSNLRFARAQVARAGLPAVGENPGPPAPQTGGTAGADPEAEQVRLSPGYARACGLAALLVAFEDDLHTGRSGTSLAALVAAINGP